jgi:urease accessory protein
MTSPALLRLLQLCSPALPIGAFAYSQGLEHAVTNAWVHDEQTAADWILGILGHSLRAIEVPLLARMYRAWIADDHATIRRWNDFLFASRAGRELQGEDQRLGNALARLLVTLEVPRAQAFTADPKATHLTLFALAAAAWNIELRDAAQGFLFSWCENQVGAAARAVPLGQSAAQRILSRAAAAIPTVVDAGLAIDDYAIGAAAPAHAIGSALHETQYSRIFRS